MNRPIDCIRCLANSRLTDIRRLGLGVDEASAMFEHISQLLRCKVDRTTAFSESFNFLKRLSGSDDPYHELKRELREAGLSIKDRLEGVVKGAKVSELLQLSSASNFFDTQVLDYSFNISNMDLRMLFEKAVIRTELSLDDIPNSFDNIYYVLDNEGEAVVDEMSINELHRRGLNVVVVVRGGAYEIDVTKNDVKFLKFESPNMIWTEGSYPPLYQGIDVDENSLIIVKGIANFEGFVDKPLHGAQVLFLMRAKCSVLTNLFRVSPNTSIIIGLEEALRVAENLREGSMHVA